MKYINGMLVLVLILFAGYARAETYLTTLKIAAGNGNKEAIFALGIGHEAGTFGLEKNHVKAIRWYRKAAKLGHHHAENRLGYMHEMGMGVEKDDTKAFELYKKAAFNNILQAQYSLGIMYSKGIGVNKNLIEASKWFKIGAKFGYSRSQRELSLMYLAGRGVPQNFVEAYKWSILAASLGDEKAIENRDLFLNLLSKSQIEEGQGLAFKWKQESVNN